MNKRNALILLAVILLIGIFLRFYKIGSESFWLDESATALSLKKYSATEIFHNTVYQGQILPGYYSSNLDLPTYYLMIKVWSNIFGISEAALRSFSAIFGIISILFLYLLSKELFGEPTAIVSSLIFSLSAVMVEYSQEARLYSLLISVALATAYFLIKYLKENKNKYFVLFILLNLLGIYIHYPFLFFVMFEIFYILFLDLKDYKNKKISFKKIHISLLVLIAAYLPLLPRILNPILVSAHRAGSFSIRSIIKIFAQFSSWIYPSADLTSKLENFQLRMINFPERILIFSFVFIVVVLSFFFVKSIFKIRNRYKSQILFLLLWILIPIIAAFSVLYSSIISFGSLRIIIFVIPPFLILASYEISNIKSKIQIIIMILLCAASLIVSLSYYTNLNNPQYREAAIYLQNNFKGNEIVIANIQSVKVPFDYYSGRFFTYGVSNIDEAREATNGKNNVWVALSLTKYSDSSGTIKKYFDNNFNLIESKKFYNVELYHYSRKS